MAKKSIWDLPEEVKPVVKPVPVIEAPVAKPVPAPRVVKPATPKPKPATAPVPVKIEKRLDGEVFMDAIKETVKKFAFEEPASLVKIIPTLLEDNAVVLGAAALAAREVFIEA